MYPFREGGLKGNETRGIVTYCDDVSETALLARVEYYREYFKE